MTESDSPLRFVPNAPHDGSPQLHGDRGDQSIGDEARWIALVALGDRQAFAEMFRAYAERLAAYAYSIVTSRETAEEIVQDVFLAIWQRREQWLVRGTLKQYLYGSVRNGALDALKRRRARRRLWSRAHHESEPPAMSIPEPQPGAALESAEIAARVRAALESLPEQQRAVIRLRWLDRLSHGEIAGVLSISVKTSENHANRAMHRLRHLLAPLRP
jgi:RNA polymerase sigma-70 factor (family 1)